MSLGTLLSHMYGEVDTVYRTVDGGWRVHCPCCRKPFTVPDSLMRDLTALAPYQFREVLMESPQAICESCRTDYGNYQGFRRAGEITERRMALEERDGMSPMVGAE